MNDELRERVRKILVPPAMETIERTRTAQQWAMDRYKQAYDEARARLARRDAEFLKSIKVEPYA